MEKERPKLEIRKYMKEKNNLAAKGKYTGKVVDQPLIMLV